MDLHQEKKDLRSSKYQKHGRDTPEGRAIYEHKLKRRLKLDVITAENIKSNVFVECDKNGNYDRNGIYFSVSNDDQHRLNTLMKCLECNKFTHYSDLCLNCSEDAKSGKTS